MRAGVEQIKARREKEEQERIRQVQEWERTRQAGG